MGDSRIDEVAVELACCGHPARLTQLERTAAVVRLTRGGLSAQQAADRLRVTQRTVQRHRRKARRSAQAVLLAQVLTEWYRLGEVELERPVADGGPDTQEAVEHRRRELCAALQPRRATKEEKSTK